MNFEELFYSAFRSVDPDQTASALETGKSLAAQSSIQFLALARNSEKYVEKFIDRVRRVGGYFKDWNLCFYENDSDDKTAVILKEAAERNSRIRSLSETLGRRHWESCRSVERGRDMGAYRERLREFSMRDGRRSDFVAVLDSDIACWSPASFLAALPVVPIRSAVWAFGVQSKRGQVVYYDSWATRIKNWRELSNRAVTLYMSRLWPGLPVEPVMSAFGGVAIYRRDFYERGSYLGTDCEHVNFHRSAALPSASDGVSVGVIHPQLVVLRNADRAALRAVQETSMRMATIFNPAR